MSLFDRFFPRRVSLTSHSTKWAYELLGYNNGKIKGERLLREGYEQNSELYSIVRKIVEVTKALPFVVEKKTDKGWEPQESSTINLLLQSPNTTKNYSIGELEEMIIVYLLIMGESFLLGERGTSKIISLDVLPNPNVYVYSNTDDFFLPSVRYEFSWGKTNKEYTSEDVEHIKYFNPIHFICGMSGASVGSNVIHTINEKWVASARMLHNKGIAGLLTDKSNSPMTPEEAELLNSKFKAENGGAESFGSIRVTNKDLNYINLAMSSEDMQMIQQGVVGLRALCNIFGLDSSLFNDPENKTYSNRTEAEKSMYTNCIIPLSTKICEHLTKFIAKNHYPDQSYRITKSFESIECLQSDKKLEAEKDKTIMEGINVILSMPIGLEAKSILLKENYDVSEEFIKSLLNNTNEGNQPV